MEISLKKPSGNVGTRTCVAGIRSQQRCYIPLTIIHPKKACVKSGVKQPCLFPFVLVNSHIITERSIERSIVVLIS